MPKQYTVEELAAFVRKTREAQPQVSDEDAWEKELAERAKAMKKYDLQRENRALRLGTATPGQRRNGLIRDW